MKKVRIMKILRENRSEASCFLRRHNTPSCDVTGKEARNWCKSVM